MQPAADASKRQRGQYFTRSKSPFELAPFQEWAAEAGLPGARILEPFAGANHIIHSLQELNLCGAHTSYDIVPAGKGVRKRDTIKNFPRNYEVCVTNPPWLARNSATRRGIPFPAPQYDNLYKWCLHLCLDNCEHVAALLPASYLQSRLFRDRLHTYILLHDLIFADTENPVCLALFAAPGKDVDIYYDDEFIGALSDLESKIPAAKTDRRIKFNDPKGQLGFISFDNTKSPTIRFCEAAEIEEYEIKESSRFITKISGDFGNIPQLVKHLNRTIHTFRADTRDLFLTPFKGIRSDGNYRRRMFFAQAREVIGAS